MPISYPSKQKWPPEPWQGIYSQFAEHAAWYSSDPNALIALTGASSRAGTPFLRQRFQEAFSTSADESRVCHVPLAADIARKSAAFLFAEEPHISCEREDTQARLEKIVAATNIHNRLSEAAEICAALGGVFLKTNWDRALSPYPLLAVVHPDNAIPEFRFGILVAATFWKVVANDGNDVYRLLERHEPGQIFNALYRGTSDELGTQVGLAYLQETQPLLPVVSTGLDRLACTYVPNMLPNRRFRSMPIGQPDIQGCESLLDSLDEIVTGLLWDVLLGQGRLAAPAQMFELGTDGNWRFDLHRRTYMPLDMGGTAGQSVDDLLKVIQHEIRTEQHVQAALYFTEQIVGAAGYAPQTFGLKLDGGPESGTALNIRERQSFLLAAKKSAYWAPALEEVFETLLMLDRVQLGSGVVPERPTVEIQDSVPQDIGQVASTVEILHRAQSASTEVRVRMQHPSWTEDKVQAEVSRILSETGMAMPDPMQAGELP